MPSARTHHTSNAYTLKPRSNNQTSKNWPASKSSDKCVFNANHDDCVTKFLKEVNSHAKVQSPSTRNSNKPVEQKSRTQKHVRQIFTGHRFSLNKSSDVHEIKSPRSCLSWKSTGRIFKTVGLSSGPAPQLLIPGTISLGLMQNPPSPTPYVPPIKNDLDILFQPMFDEYLNPPKSVVSTVPVAASPGPVDLTSTPLSTSINQDAPSISTSSTQEQLQSSIIFEGVEE
ncbi:hypothetical protein Tco_1026807 [Tanacetum coccineum]